MKKRIAIYPILFSVFPGMSLYVSSMSQVQFKEALGVIILSALLAAILMLITFLLVRDVDKAALITSAFVLLFFSHSHILKSLLIVIFQLTGPDNAVLIAENELVPTLWLGIWFALFLVAFWAIAKSSRDFGPVTRFLNVIGLVLVLTVLANWLYVYFQANEEREYVAAWGKSVAAKDSERSADVAPESLPDIYYIIVDGYAASEVLEEIYGIDNFEFLSYLTENGFYVADKSRANYGQTALSLASSMNFIYLDELTSTLPAESDNRQPLRTMIANPHVVRHLRYFGYSTLSFSTGYSLTELSNADQYLSPRWRMSEFQGIFVSTTPIPILLELPFLRTRYDLHRETMSFALDHLADAAEIDSPTFVFAHIIAPHPPFVFGANGEPLEPSHSRALGGGFSLHDGSDYVEVAGKRSYVQGYRDQLTFITKRLQTTIQEILTRSPEPPIIILQADHGPGSMLDWNSAQNSNLLERMSILNAYYFPGQDYEMLYPEITPVNTFRVILNEHFGTEYELLDDRSYFSGIETPYLLLDVTEEVRASDSKQ
jgi:hypothetical protein